MLLRPTLLAGALLIALAGPGRALDAAAQTAFDSLVEKHAGAHGIPAELIHRVIRAESGYNARAAHRGYYGLMQISYATARGMGYSGPASGLLDADTNLSVAVPYLAKAYRVAGGNGARAVRFYKTGFYYAAKRQGLSGQLATAPAGMAQPVVQAQPAATGPATFLASLFGQPTPAAEPVQVEPVATGSVGRVRHRRSRHHRS